MDRYTPLRLVTQLVEHVACALRDRLDPIEERLARTRALKPGTKVRLNCSCPTCSGIGSWRRDVVWTVVRYDYDGDDYAIECMREVVPGQASTYSSYEHRDKLEVVE